MNERTTCCQTQLEDTPFSVRVTRHADGEVWTAEFCAPTGEALMCQEYLGKLAAHDAAALMIDGAQTALSLLRNLPGPMVDRIKEVILEELQASQRKGADA